MEDDQFDARLSRLSTPITRRAGLLSALGAAGMVTEAEARKKHKKKKKKKKVTTTLAPTTRLPTTTPVPPPSTVVISQVYTHGGDNGATYNRDYIQLLSHSTQVLNVGDWSVQVSGAASPTWSVIPLTGVVLHPNQYLLIAAHQGANGDPLPGSDLGSAVTVPSGGGRIALVASATPLTCGESASCVTAPGVIDFLGYGAGTSAEGGSPAPLPSATQALFRSGDGCTETNNNNADFSLKTPLPRTSAFSQVCS